MRIFRLTAIYWLFLFLFPLGVYSASVEVDIPYGSTLTNISRILYEKRVIPSQTVFKVAATLSGKSSSLKSGHYRLPLSDNTFDFKHIIFVLNTLDDGVGIQVQITIPEGLTKKEIFTLLRKSGLKNSGNYEKYDRDPAILNRLRKINPKISNTEGFYFPDTYHFSVKTHENNILNAIINNFFEKAGGKLSPSIKSSDLNPYKILILASIIEKETGAEKERRIISSVFHNRLKRRIRLATDPTVIYGIKNFDGNLKRIHLKTPTAYNTYLIKGLPPTPIANPGIASIEAAVNPADTKYLYFVAKGDGTSYFSTSLRQHTNAVNKYQLNRRKGYRSY